MSATGKFGTVYGYDMWQAFNDYITENGLDDLHRIYEGYSGTIASTDGLNYLGDWSKYTDKKINEKLDNVLDSNYDKEIWAAYVGIDHYDILSTEYTETKKVDNFTREMLYKAVVKARNGKAKPVLLKIVNGNIKVIAVNTIVNLKKIAHKNLRDCKYADDYYIVTNKALIRCDAEVKSVKNTKRTSTEKQLILPVKKYKYCAWCRC